LAHGIRKQLLDLPINSPLHLLPPHRENVPPPESVARLPRKYRPLIADYEDHPGEGRGRGAVKSLLAELDEAPKKSTKPVANLT
jgi:hypothetical protein